MIGAFQVGPFQLAYQQTPSSTGPAGKTLRRRRRRHKYGQPEVQVERLITYEGVTDQGLQDWELPKLIQETADLRSMLTQAVSDAAKMEKKLDILMIQRQIAENEERILQIEEEELVNILPYFME